MVLVTASRNGFKARQLGLETGGQDIEGHRDFVDALGQQLERLQIAVRHLPSVVHDQDVVAELFGLAQDLRRQDDRPSLARFLTQRRHDRALQDRIHAGGELVEEHDRRLDHEDLRDLHAALEAAAEILHLLAGLCGQAEVVEHAVGPPADRGCRQPVKAGEHGQIVPRGQQQIGRLLLNDDRDPPPHVERCADHIETGDQRASGRSAAAASSES